MVEVNFASKLKRSCPLTIKVASNLKRGAPPTSNNKEPIHAYQILFPL